MPAMVVRLTAPGPRPFLAMESDARQSGTCAPQARTVTPSRSADIPIVSQPDANTHRMLSVHRHLNVHQPAEFLWYGESNRVSQMSVECFVVGDTLLESSNRAQTECTDDEDDGCRE